MIGRIALLLLLALGGCAANDSYGASDEWQPTGANAGNLAAMAAHPRDLIAGHGRAAGDRLAADSVERVWDGKARALTGGTASAPASSGSNAGKGSN